MKTAIITDSTCNLTKEYLGMHSNLFVIPLGISINNDHFKDQVDITSSEVYAKLDSHDVKSSLPSIGEVLLKVEEVVAQGYDKILFVNISSGLSGTLNAIRLAVEELETDITIYDSKTLAMGLGYVVKKAVELINKGISIEETVKALDTFRYNKMLTIYTLDTLKYLRAGGRIGKVEGTIGNILKIKPIITVNDKGVYETIEKGRGNRRALSKTIEIATNRFKGKKINLTVHYGNDYDKASMLLERLKETLDIQDSELIELTPVLGIHTGPGLIAVIGHEV